LSTNPAGRNVQTMKLDTQQQKTDTLKNEPPII